MMLTHVQICASNEWTDTEATNEQNDQLTVSRDSFLDEQKDVQNRFDHHTSDVCETLFRLDAFSLSVLLPARVWYCATERVCVHMLAARG